MGIWDIFAVIGIVFVTLISAGLALILSQMYCSKRGKK